jgi:hypothetical protein
MYARIIGGFFLLSLSVVVFAEDGDGCSDVLSFSGRNYTEDSLDFSVAQRVYDQYCQDGTAKSGMSFESGAEVVIKAVPLSGHLSGGSTSEQVTNFCKTFDSSYRHDERRRNSTSLVDRYATSAWLACKELTAKGVFFRPRLQRTAFTIEVKRKNVDAVAVQGIIYDSKLLSCSVPNSDVSLHHRISADPDTQKELGTDYWPVTCTRVPTTEDNVTFYPEADIQVSTTQGTFPLTIPAEPLFPLRWATQIANRQDYLDSTLLKVQASLKSIGNDLDQGQRAFVRGQKYNLACPAGQFVSAIAATEWNSDHNDALVANIGVQCRRASADPDVK